jgi:hypothetical protein
MRKYFILLFRLLFGIAGAISAYYFIRMFIDKMSVKKKLFELQNPFGGEFFYPFLMWLGIAIGLGLIGRVFLTKNQN